MAAWSIACRATPSSSCSSPWPRVGLPGTSGFVGEFLVLVGAFKANTWVAFLATTGMILGAAYMLWLYRRVIFGKLTKDSLKGILDLTAREIAVFAAAGPADACGWASIRPPSSIPWRPSVDKLIGDYQAAIEARPHRRRGAVTPGVTNMIVGLESWTLAAAGDLPRRRRPPCC